MSSITTDRSTALDKVLPAVKAFAIGIILSAVLLFAFTGIAFFSKDPDSLTGLLGYGALYISSAVMGTCAARMSGDKGIVSSALSGVMMLTLLILMSFLPMECTGNAVSPIVNMLMYAAVPGASVLAGLLFGKRKPVKHRRHRRR